MEPMTVRELLAATDGKLLGDVSLDTTISGVETDSRAVHDGDLFVAIRGENIDGHQFITGALEGGALGCLTAVPPKEAVPGKFYVLVEDTVQALGQVARAYKAKFPIPVIGITGSVGKTTTKDMIASVLSQKFRVLKTEGNYNNEIGLPLTLFRLNLQHELCVLEMGMNHFGEIDYLTRIVSPNVAVITNIGDAHIENLGSREGILKAKSEIFQAMTGDDLAVLNGDDPLLRTLDGKIAPGILWCGADHEPPYEAKEIRQMGAKGLQCKIKTPKTEFAVTIPALGNHMIYPVLMACAIGEKFDMTGEEMKKGVEAFVPTKMRMNVIRQGDVTILDDAYNANPQSMRAALEVLSQTDATFRVAVLGDMFELGELGPELHRGMGECAAALGNIDALLAVGELAWNIYDAAHQAGMEGAIYAKDRAAAKPLLANFIRPGAVILVKASRGMAFEELTRELQRLAPKN